MQENDFNAWQNSDADAIRERVIWVTREFAGSRYSYLEERTGIAARKWKNMCNRVTYPSPEMMCQLALVRPYFAAWMLTGYRCGNQQDPIKEPDWHKKLLQGVVESGSQITSNSDASNDGN